MLVRMTWFMKNIRKDWTLHQTGELSSDNPFSLAQARISCFVLFGVSGNGSNVDKHLL